MGNQKKIPVSSIVHEQDLRKRNENYKKYVEENTPKNSIVKDTIQAFIVGGIICTIGQFFISYYQYLGAGEEAAKARSEEHTSELQSLAYLVCRLLLEKKKEEQGPLFR